MAHTEGSVGGTFLLPGLLEEATLREGISEHRVTQQGLCPLSSDSTEPPHPLGLSHPQGQKATADHSRWALGSL